MIQIVTRELSIICPHVCNAVMPLYETTERLVLPLPTKLFLLGLQGIYSIPVTPSVPTHLAKKYSIRFVPVLLGGG